LETVIENLFKYIDIDTVSPQERSKVEIYLNIVRQPFPEWDNPGKLEPLQMACGYVRTFDDDPYKAAEAYFKMRISWNKAYNDYIEKDIPKQPHSEIEEWWEQNPGEVHPIHEVMCKNAAREAQKLIDSEYYSFVYGYIYQINVIKN
jgi:hypothetical protein